MYSTTDVTSEPVTCHPSLTLALALFLCFNFNVECCLSFLPSQTLDQQAVIYFSVCRLFLLSFFLLLPTGRLQLGLKLETDSDSQALLEYVRYAHYCPAHGSGADSS